MLQLMERKTLASTELFTKSESEHCIGSKTLNLLPIYFLYSTQRNQILFLFLPEQKRKVQPVPKYLPIPTLKVQLNQLNHCICKSSFHLKTKKDKYNLSFSKMFHSKGHFCVKRKQKIVNGRLFSSERNLFLTHRHWAHKTLC